MIINPRIFAEHPPATPREQSFDVVAFGGATVDSVFTVDHLPAHDEKVLGKLIAEMPGGPAGNFACAASRLGLRVASLANVGNDPNGIKVIEDFDRYGVDTSMIRILENERTNFTVNMIDATGEKAILVAPLTPDEYPLDVAEEILRHTRLFFIMPSDPDQFLALAALARRGGADVMIDVEATVAANPAALRKLLAGTDIASFNRRGFVTATGTEPTEESARGLFQYGPHTVAITLGAEGALAVSRDEASRKPSWNVEVIDTTGAGDVFNAAFAWKTLQGAPLDERLEFATAAGALAVTGYGPRGHLPTEEEIREVMKSQNART